MTDRRLLDEHRLNATVREWAKQCGRRLQTRRKTLKYSQSTLAAVSGVGATAISKFELGLAVPKDAVRLAIAAALLCEVGEIWPYPDRDYVTAVARAEVAA